jgi:hypothetical protein
MMAYTSRRLEYFYATLTGGGNDAIELLDSLASLGVNFHAVTLVPIGPDSTQLTLFPEDSAQLQTISKQTGLAINGPHQAVIVQGDDEIGVLAAIHRQLRNEQVEVFASNAVTDGKGRFGCILFLRPEQAENAIRALTH